MIKAEDYTVVKGTDGRWKVYFKGIGYYLFMGNISDCEAYIRLKVTGVNIKH